MNESEDDIFDRELQEHFAKRLDGQLGAAPAILTQLRRWQRLRITAWSSVFAAAAAIAMVATFTPLPIIHPRNSAVTAPADEWARSLTEYESSWQTSDDGTIYLDEDSPMRTIHRREIEMIRFADQISGATVELTIPHDEFVLVPLNTY